MTLGQGRPLLDGPLEPRRWRLASSRTYDDVGVVLLAYERAVSAAGS